MISGPTASSSVSLTPYLCATFHSSCFRAIRLAHLRFGADWGCVYVSKVCKAMQLWGQGQGGYVTMDPPSPQAATSSNSVIPTAVVDVTQPERGSLIFMSSIVVLRLPYTPCDFVDEMAGACLPRCKRSLQLAMPTHPRIAQLSNTRKYPISRKTSQFPPGALSTASCNMYTVTAFAVSRRPVIRLKAACETI
jgi:hypothetical protein